MNTQLKAPLPENEETRLQVLRNYQILDTLPEEALDDIVFIASRICKTPIAVISLVDENRQWFKAKIGLDVSETPREFAFCAHAILETEALVVPDTLKDKRFADNPLVTGEPGIRFYAGAPLLTADGYAIGVLCVVDRVPRELDREQLRALSALSRQVIEYLELRRSSKLLREDVAKRKQMEKELLKSKDAAEIATQAKSDFLAVMSHEVRTPLNAVIGMTRLLMGTPLSKEQEEYVSTIHLSGEAMLSVINDILDFSKIESGKIELEQEPFDLCLCIQDTFKICSQKALQKGLVLKHFVDLDVPSLITGDMTRVRQILLNLVGNAIKFTNQGEVTVLVRKLFEKDGKLELLFSVRDTGMGIPADKLHKLFKPFSQIDSSTTRKFGGTGLGLNISASLVDLLGGKIWAESRANEGSTFNFTIAVHAADIGLISSEKSYIQNFNKPLKAIDPAFATSHPLDILIAEDNPINQQLILYFLKKMGYSPHIAANGLEVLAALEQKRYDLIFMDIQMPKVDGIETAQQILFLWGNKRPRIIAMTANTTQDDISKAFQSGMDDYLTKPIIYEEIERVLEKWSEIPVKSLANAIPNTPVLIDKERIALLEELSREVPSFRVEGTMRSFFESATSSIMEIRHAFVDQDFQKISNIAHQLKGASLNLGAVHLAEISGSLELSVKKSDSLAIPDIVNTLEQCYEQTAIAFDALKGVCV